MSNQSTHQGNVFIMKTDTLYGILAPAFDQQAVERVYTLKQRDPSKPCIILIYDIDQLTEFGIELSVKQKELAIKLWNEAPTSIIFPVNDDSLSYLHRGTGSLAFRIPADLKLHTLLAQKGPHIAPSANPQSKEPAIDIQQAKEYFGDSIDVYIDGGICIETKASRVLSIQEDGELVFVRS